MDILSLQNQLKDSGYLAGEELATVLALSLALEKPLFLEGPAGVGKTELALAYARAKGLDLVRLQCYEGLDQRQALYEWNYRKQLLYLENRRDEQWQDIENNLFGEDFLLERPLLKAIRSDKQVVLLIDEIDKSDEEFEAFLLELLADFAVTIPEYGRIEAKVKPVVFLTANGSRDFSDGLKRRCVHYYIDYPDAGAEKAIIRSHVGDVSDSLLEEITDYVHGLRRDKNLKRPPSTAEAVDWTKALQMAGVTSLQDPSVGNTLHFLLKNHEDKIR